MDDKSILKGKVLNNRDEIRERKSIFHERDHSNSVNIFIISVFKLLKNFKRA